MTSARVSEKQREVMERLYSAGNAGKYRRDIGRLQSAGLEIDGEAVPRGSVTIEALEIKGLVEIDRTRWTDPVYPVRLTDAGLDALDGVR